MKILFATIHFVFVFSICTMSFGQTESGNIDSPDANKIEKPAKNDKSTSDLEVKMMRNVIEQAFDQVDLSEEQKTKIFATLDENVANLVEANTHLRSQFSAEEHKIFRKNFRLARLGHFTVARADNFALSKLELSKERLAAYATAKEQADFQEKKFNNEIAAVLTKEQKVKLPMFNKDIAPTIRGGVVLPNMKTDADVEFVKEKMLGIGDLKIVKVDEDKNLIRFEVTKGTKVLSTLNKYAEQGVEQFVGYTPEIVSDDFAELLKPKKNVGNGNAKKDAVEDAARNSEDESKPTESEKSDAGKGDTKKGVTEQSDKKK